MVKNKRSETPILSNIFGVAAVAGVYRRSAYLPAAAAPLEPKLLFGPELGDGW